MTIQMSLDNTGLLAVSAIVSRPVIASDAVSREGEGGGALSSNETMAEPFEMFRGLHTNLRGRFERFETSSTQTDCTSLLALFTAGSLWRSDLGTVFSRIKCKAVHTLLQITVEKVGKCI